MRFEIGQQVWRPSFDNEPAYITCPDCGGSGRLRVTFHDETQVSIECKNCSVGYDPPSGRIKCYNRMPRAELETITGCEIGGGKVEWRTSGTYRVDASELFDNEADCMIAAMAKAAQFDADDRQRILTKEKDTRSWAWNASYHRKCIKEAQRQIEYHTAKLNVAKVKAKEPEQS